MPWRADGSAKYTCYPFVINGIKSLIYEATWDNGKYDNTLYVNVSNGYFSLFKNKSSQKSTMHLAVHI